MDPITLHVNVPDFRPAITYADGMLMVGSCFTEHISTKLQRYKYNVVSNPFGILYNPVSMAVSMERIAMGKHYHADELVEHGGLYHSMDHHGSFSGKDIEAVLSRINKTIDAARLHLASCKVVCISPGTAQVYSYLPTELIAGNCHKIPQSRFAKVLLTAEECVSAYERMLNAIRSIAPGCRILFTISPVRHVRDGLVENQRSKAILHYGFELFQRHHPEVYYFPAYEIMMDELRDYRYYDRDLVHPSPLAIDIIWEKFAAACLETGDRDIHPLIEKIKKAMEHRFLHHDPESIRNFASGQLKQIELLAAQMPDLDWQQERQYFFQYLELD